MIQEVVENAQKAVNSQTTVLVITVIAVLVLIGWEFFVKIFPPIRDAMHSRFKREQADSQQQKKLDELEAYRAAAEAQTQEAAKALKDMGNDVQKMHAQMDYLLETNQLLLQGMLNILMCMEGSKDSTECARNAIGQINAFLVKNNGPLQ